MCEAVCSLSALSWLLSPLQFLCLGGGGGEGDCYDPADLEILIFCLILVVYRTGWLSLHQAFTVFRGFFAKSLVYFRRKDDLLIHDLHSSCLGHVNNCSQLCLKIFSPLIRVTLCLQSVTTEVGNVYSIWSYECGWDFRNSLFQISTLFSFFLFLNFMSN